MAGQPSGKPAPSSPSQGLPSEGFRAAVSIALCLYLLGFALTVAGNSGSGSSTLVRTLKTKLFSPWMVPLWLDLGFDYRLTYGQIDDADYALEVTPWGGAADGAAVRFPPAGSAGIAANRWRTLAMLLEPDTLPEETNSALTASIAENLFSELDAEDLRVRVLRAPMPERTGFSAESSADARPEQAAVARVRRVAGSVQLLPVEQQRDVAPVVSPAAGTPDAAGSGGNEQGDLP